MLDLNNISERKKTIIALVFIILVILIGYLFFGGHYNNLLTDFGREMLFPEAILDGKVLYKDILCIYFPLAYQINALGYMLFGANLSTLETFGLINSIIFASVVFLIAKEFLNNKISLLITLLMIFSAVFNGTLFNFILPYSTSLTYGITAYILSIYLLIKYLKTENIYFSFVAYLIAGFAFACKGEFCLLFLILFFISVIKKPCGLKNNIINILLFLFFPIVSFGFLFFQGLTVNEFLLSLDFMKKFFTTDSMVYHIGKTGGVFTIENFQKYSISTINFLIFAITSFILFFFTKNNFGKYFAVLISAILLNYTVVWLHSLMLPLIVFVVFVCKYKNIYSDITLFVLFVSSLFLTVRMFWALTLSTYGIFTLALLLIVGIVLLLKILPEFKYLNKNDLEKFVIFLLSAYILFFLSFDIYQRNINNTPIKTEKGIIYLPQKEAETINYAINYIEKYSNSHQKILVLPEGTAINFLVNRDIDLKMHMIDRLYFEAFDEKYILENLKNADYEMVFVIKGFGLTNFGKPYLYSDNNIVMKYLKDNYYLDWQTSYDKKGKENLIKCFVKPYM